MATPYPHSDTSATPPIRKPALRFYPACPAWSAWRAHRPVPPTLPAPRPETPQTPARGWRTGAAAGTPHRWRHPGPARAVQVGGRGAQHAPVGGDAAGDHAAVGRLAETHAHVLGIVGDRRGVHRQLQVANPIRGMAAT